MFQDWQRKTRDDVPIHAHPLPENPLVALQRPRTKAGRPITIFCSEPECTDRVGEYVDGKVVLFVRHHGKRHRVVIDGA